MKITAYNLHLRLLSPEPWSLNTPSLPGSKEPTSYEIKRSGPTPFPHHRSCDDVGSRREKSLFISSSACPERRLHHRATFPAMKSLSSFFWLCSACVKCHNPPSWTAPSTSTSWPANPASSTSASQEPSPNESSSTRKN